MHVAPYGALHGVLSHDAPYDGVQNGYGGYDVLHDGVQNARDGDVLHGDARNGHGGDVRHDGDDVRPMPLVKPHNSLIVKPQFNVTVWKRFGLRDYLKYLSGIRHRIGV